jgi:hypothetical protein
MPAGPQGFSTKCRLGDTICYAPASLRGGAIGFPPTDNPVGDDRCCGDEPFGLRRNGALELPPGPASIQPAPAALSWPPRGPVAADASGAGPAGVQPAPAALSGPPPGPVAADASGAPPTQQDTIARTGFDVHGNPAATPGQKKPFFLDPLLQ